MLNASDRFVDVVQEGYDITLRDHFSPLPDSGLVQRRIRTESFWLVAAPDYLADEQVPLDPADIDGWQGLFAAQGETGWTLQNKEGASLAVTLQPRYYANEGAGLLAAAIAGLGIACLPSSMCQSAVRSGALTRVVPDWDAGSVTITLLMPHRRGQLPSVRVVADLIVEQLKRD